MKIFFQVQLNNNLKKVYCNRRINFVFIKYVNSNDFFFKQHLTFFLSDCILNKNILSALS